MAKVKFILPLLLILALATWWFIPHDSEEDKAYYVAVFCAIDHHGQQPFDQQMRNVIEGGNSDYALQKIAYKPRLGRSVIGRWEQLTNDEQQRAAQDNMVCQQLLMR
ncbi:MULTISPECIES: hypothetical protein [unclassified Pantoea]|nr:MULTISPECIES: hypothetical protein [unclassified Pantoea]KAA5923414.1 hypothetical protein F3I59_20935 [Pantoea sp. VH_8]KAA5929158.1 hypothetical protein F3I58_21150 [Pantoea sp. VH_4]KAA5950138.1 hypothetical protein F3I56_16080 [Pantoea sp. VH_25]KAA5952434.1 hypothetical protein F3I53_23435 [Pantoea sp. VH_16]KAA5957885.1 hypothetical protein F3I55_07245 [Pantoea sp. VH_24]